MHFLHMTQLCKHYTYSNFFPDTTEGQVDLKV